MSTKKVRRAGKWLSGTAFAYYTQGPGFKLGIERTKKKTHK